MDQNQDGLIDAEELVEFYTVDLPQERWKFDLIVDQLLEAATIMTRLSYMDILYDQIVIYGHIL